MIISHYDQPQPLLSTAPIWPPRGHLDLRGDAPQGHAAATEVRAREGKARALEELPKGAEALLGGRGNDV